MMLAPSKDDVQLYTGQSLHCEMRTAGKCSLCVFFPWIIGERRLELLWYYNNSEERGGKAGDHQVEISWREIFVCPFAAAPCWVWSVYSIALENRRCWKLMIFHQDGSQVICLSVSRERRCVVKKAFDHFIPKTLLGQAIKHTHESISGETSSFLLLSSGRIA